MGIFAPLMPGTVARGAVGEASAEDYRLLASQTDADLRRDVLSKWFPAAVDKEGDGFFENFAGDWTRSGENGHRSIVYQSRLTWLASEAASYDAGSAAEYLKITREGIDFLAGKQWDQKFGGFFWSVDAAGNRTDDRPDEKHTYGISFGIYASASSHRVTGDAASLELAKRAFNWLDGHAHDAQHGGYFEALSRDGTPLPAMDGRDAIGTPYGEKSMNTHIHLLESLQELYGVWPEPIVRARLEEVFEIVSNKIYTEPGYLTMYFEPDWKAVPGRDSYGHDVETAYLLVEAAARLGKPDDARTWLIARRLVDHALKFGFDQEHGGFYNEGSPAGGQLAKEKIWWVQAEGLNALLLMHEQFGGETSVYWQCFQQQWAFISKFQIDHEHGGWYPTVNADGTPRIGLPKSDRWTEGYHQGRALMNVTERLRRLAGEEK